MKGRSWPGARPAAQKVAPLVAGKGSVRPPGGAVRPAAPGQVRPGQKAPTAGIRAPNSTGGPRPVAARPGQQAAAVKKPGEVAGVIKKPPVPATATGKDAPKYSVTSQSKTDDIGIQTLVGDYADKGVNHGKRYYQKLQKIPGHEDIKVFLYFWDNRDGADFSGWWFGDQVGGTQVWARNPSPGPLPPRTGWKVPWDSPSAKPGLLFVDPYKAPTAAGTGAQAPAKGTVAATPGSGATAGGDAALAARIKKANEKVDQAEKAANATIAKVKAALAGDSPPEDELSELQITLQKQQMTLSECLKST